MTIGLWLCRQRISFLQVCIVKSKPVHVCVPSVCHHVCLDRIDGYAYILVKLQRWCKDVANAGIGFYFLAWFASVNYASINRHHLPRVVLLKNMSQATISRFANETRARLALLARPLEQTNRCRAAPKVTS